MPDAFRPKRKLTKRIDINIVYGWGTWIRTRISGVRFPAASSCLPRLKPGTVLSFGDRASFTGTAFGQYASFTGGVVFGAQASFEFAAFDSAARFDAADFDAGVSFRGATFGGGASFQEAVIGSVSSADGTVQHLRNHYFDSLVLPRL